MSDCTPHAAEHLDAERDRVLRELDETRKRIEALEPISAPSGESNVIRIADLIREAEAKGYAAGYEAGHAAALDEAEEEREG